MNEVEVIMISSDEENDTAGQTVPTSASSKPKNKTNSKIVQNPVKTFDYVVNLEKVLTNSNKHGRGYYPGYKIFNKPKLNTSSIEVVNLGVDDNNSSDISESSDSSKKARVNNSANEKEKNHSKPQTSQSADKTENFTNLQTDNNVKDLEKENFHQIKEDVLPTTNSINFDFFDEFVNLCGAIEDNENDKRKLMEKLRKRYSKANVRYIESEEFKNLIESNKKKLNKKNLYLIANEISFQLNYNKKLIVKINSSNENERNSEMNSESVNKMKKEKLKRRLIKKIKRKLNDLGMKIKELEEQEVDLSDDESAYVNLQMYRRRFCTIYEKLCKLTNGVSNNQRISFTESKYPAINKCIEKWLNETKKFPDFLDILKLLETQSSSLGLSSKKDSLREIATEIFQNVGLMLKRRRCCDMWDSFSGFLGSSMDPSIENPELNEKLKKNFEEGIKKEQEIINFYAEKQEKEHLKPEEVLDEDADKSPVESESEEDDEIGILSDETINKESETSLKKEGESKNNFKNCKSLKYRCENGSSNNNNNSNYVEKPHVNNYVGGEPSKQMKRSNEIGNKLEPRKKACLVPIITKVESLRREESSDKKMGKPEVYDLYSCQIKLHYDAFYKLDFIDEFFKSKKDFKKKKVFRDLTNVGNLMKLAGKRKDYPVLFSRSISYNKPSWKIRRNVDINKFSNFKVQKCGSNQDEKSEKSVRRNSRNSKSKEYSSNSDNKEEESAYFSGSGNEENNNGDENKKKNVNIDNDEEENQNEEDEEEENETEENLHSKTNVSPPTDSTAIEVKTLEDVNSSLTQVKNEIIDVKEIKDIQIEKNTTVGIKREGFNENEVSEKGKEEIENANNGEVNGPKKISSDCVVEDKVKSFSVKRESENVVKNTKKVNERSDSNDCPVIMDDEEEAIFIEQLNPIVEINTFKTPSIPRRSSCESRHPPTQSYVQSQKLYEVETIVQRMRQQNSNQSPSDEERVKRFLLNSPSSISITPPKKLQCKNPLSQEALQALETLKNLKGISATRVVREKPESEDDVIVIGESSAKSRRPNPRYQVPPKQRRVDQNPNDAHTIKQSQPRLPTPQVNQNQYLFNNCNKQSNGEKSHDSSSIKISNVWGALSLKVYESISNNNNNLVAALDSSSRQRRSKSSFSNNLATSRKKKTSNQPVEYVVLD